MHDAALQPTALDSDRARLAALELEVAQRDHELAAIKRELHALQSRYLDQIGGLYARLNELETAIAEAEIAAGLRPPPGDADDEDDADAGPAGPAASDIGAAAGCGHRTAPSADLKRIFRQLAKTIHPDLAHDGPAKYRRHSLMAEANRAYAERDEDRLRLILSAWERSPEAVIGDDPESNQLRTQRRIAVLEEHLVAMAAEMADLHTSAIWRLKVKLDDAKQQGWDLFAEMVREVERETRRASARLSKLKRAAPRPV